jgi:hypothetical protein
MTRQKIAELKLLFRLTSMSCLKLSQTTRLADNIDMA